MREYAEDSKQEPLINQIQWPGLEKRNTRCQAGDWQFVCLSLNHDHLIRLIKGSSLLSSTFSYFFYFFYFLII